MARAGGEGWHAVLLAGDQPGPQAAMDPAACVQWLGSPEHWNCLVNNQPCPAAITSGDRAGPALLLTMQGHSITLCPCERLLASSLQPAMHVNKSCLLQVGAP